MPEPIGDTAEPPVGGIIGAGESDEAPIGGITGGGEGSVLLCAWSVLLAASPLGPVGAYIGSGPELMGSVLLASPLGPVGAYIGSCGSYIGSVSALMGSVVLCEGPSGPVG